MSFEKIRRAEIVWGESIAQDVQDKHVNNTRNLVPKRVLSQAMDHRPVQVFVFKYGLVAGERDARR